MRGPEGPRGSARYRREVTALVAARPLAFLILETTAADTELQYDVGHPVSDVAELPAFIVVGEERIAALSALRALALAFLLAPDGVFRTWHANTHWHAALRHF